MTNPDEFALGGRQNWSEKQRQTLVSVEVTLTSTSDVFTSKDRYNNMWVYYIRCVSFWPCFPPQPSLFQPDEAYRCVTQDVLSSLVSFAREEKGCSAGVISTEITASAPDSTDAGWVGGWVHGSGPVYITVTVGNRIHQIKPSIYLSGSGDSGEERGGGLWEGVA